MKKSLFAVMIILAPFLAHGQYNFSFPELQKLANKNPTDFETAVLEKDYSLQSAQSDKLTKVYTSDKKDAGGKHYVISRYQVPNAMAKITFSTTDKKHYLALKSQLAAGGIRFVNEESKSIDNVQAACYNYASGACKVNLCTYTTDVTWYKIEVHY